MRVGGEFVILFGEFTFCSGGGTFSAEGMFFFFGGGGRWAMNRSY